MPVISTVLKEFSDNGNSRTYTVAGHSVPQPFLVIQKRKVPASIDSVGETSARVVRGTSDANDVPIAQRISFETVARVPVGSTPADVAAALALHREIVASDEYADAVNTQNWLK